jgi:hypothetical protein
MKLRLLPRRRGLILTRRTRLKQNPNILRRLLVGTLMNPLRRAMSLRVL